MLKLFRRFVLMNLLIPSFRMVSGIFFDKRYLRGKYFDASLVGWRWVWRSFWTQRFLGINKHVPWPVSSSIAVDDPKGINFDLDDMQNFLTFGCYFSNANGGKITIGKGSYIAPNVGIITTNHDLNDPDRHCSPRDVTLGEKCWLGMNVVVLPGVILGDHTIVAAGSVVTKSFPEGWAVLAGSPAKILKKIER